MLCAGSAEAVHNLPLPSALCHVPGQEGTVLAASGPAAQGAAAKLQLEGNAGSEWHLVKRQSSWQVLEAQQHGANT